MQLALQTLLTPLRFVPPVIAHRGARTYAPENTLAAFKLAHESGVNWIETDVKLTHDGIPVLMHDENLDRTTNGNGDIANTLWETVKTLDAGSWFNPGFTGEGVPRLADALSFAIDHNMQINLEIKPSPGRTQATTMVTIIETAKIWPQDRAPPLISSFDIEALTIAAGLHPEWPRGLLLDGWHEDWPELVRKTKAATIHMNADVLTADRIAALVSSRLPVLAYTVNDPRRAKELLHSGVSAIFSDDPKEMLRAL